MNATFQRAGRSRADLVRLFASIPREERADAALMLGFVREREVVKPRARHVIVVDPSALPDEPTDRDSSAMPLPTSIVQTPLWRFEEMHFHYEPDQSEPAREEVRGLTEEDLQGMGQSLFATPKSPSLAPWPKLWPRLRHALRATIPSRDPDVAQWVRRVSQGEIVTRMPRLERKAWPERLSVWIDRSRRLLPFWSDQMEVVRQLYKVCDRRNLMIRWLDGHSQASALMRRGDYLDKVRPDSQTPLLLLGDLGCFGTDADRAAWRKTGHRLRRLEIRLSALVPGSRARWTPGLARTWNGLPWEQGRSRSGIGLSKHTNTWQDRAERLLTLISPAAYVQPGLLRALRLLLPPDQADASTEADVWNHADVRGADAAGMVLQSDAAEKWRNVFATRCDPALKERVSQQIAHWHERLPRELLRAETLVWLSVAPNVHAPGDVQDALDFASRLEGSVMASGDDPQWADAVKRYGHALLAGMPEAIYKQVPALQSLWVASFQGMPAPNGIDPAEIRRKIEKPGETRHWYVRQVGSQWVFGLNERGTEWPSYIQGPGSPLAWFEASRPWVTVVRGKTVEEHRLEPGLTLSFDLDEPVELRTDRCMVRLVPWVRESWAIAAGRDRFGLWADANIRGVVQRFRWIPPGRFLMGSPENEVGRFDDEGPQHWVTFMGGRWFGDTPVTQMMWANVMGTNPSYCPGPDRPVERVTWTDCNEFANAIEIAVMRLPIEEEWEFACRGGTGWATWRGNPEIVDSYVATLIDSIAWYRGNSNLDFMAVNANSPSIPVEPDLRGVGSHDVGQKMPNPFGLYDMLGNVYEWCSNKKAPYSEGNLSDPEAREAATNERALRGGWWGSKAGKIRAARRYGSNPWVRDPGQGLRLVIGPVPGKTKP